MRLTSRVLCAGIIAAMSMSSLSTSLAAQTPILYGNTVTGTIECGGSRKYTITASAGDKLMVHAIETADFGGVCFGVASLAFDQCVEVQDSDANLLGQACTPLSFNVPTRLRTQLGPVTLTQGGQYTITVRDANDWGRGAFALWLQKTSSPATADTLGGSGNGVRLVPIQSAGEVKTFTLNATQDHVVALEMRSLSGAIVPRLALYGPDGAVVALPDSGMIRYKIQQTGQHTLLAFSAVQETGTAELVLSTITPNIGNVLSIPQIVEGSGWKTLFALVNLDSVAVSYTVRFWNGDGQSLNLPISGRSAGNISGTLAPGRAAYAETPGTTQQLMQGWAEVESSGRMGGVAIFRYGAGTLQDSQGSASATVSGSSIYMPFDNTQGHLTGVAVANTNPTQTLTVSLQFETEAGATSTGSLSLPAHGHGAFMLPTMFPATAGVRGSVRFSAPSPDISVLGLRFTPSLTFTSLGAFQ